VARVAPSLIAWKTKTLSAYSNASIARILEQRATRPGDGANFIPTLLDIKAAPRPAAVVQEWPGLNARAVPRNIADRVGAPATNGVAEVPTDFLLLQS